MGGINCPPPPKTGDIPAELRKEYVVQLATYSGHLFSGSSDFFAGNAMIELAIVDGGDMTMACAEFDSAIGNFAKARESLSKFQATWAMIDSGHGGPDFSAQISRLGTLVDIITSAGKTTDEIALGEDIQTQIWDMPSLTDDMIGASALIAESISWQSDFAKQYANQLVLAAV